MKKILFLGARTLLVAFLVAIAGCGPSDADHKKTVGILVSEAIQQRTPAASYDPSQLKETKKGEEWVYRWPEDHVWHYKCVVRYTGNEYRAVTTKLNIFQKDED